MKDMRTVDSRLSIYVCKDAVKFMSHVCPVSHSRMWDVRKAQSVQAINPTETLNFRSLSSSALLCTLSHSLMYFRFPEVHPVLQVRL